MKATIQINDVYSGETVHFIHESIERALRDNVRVSITLSPEDGKPKFPRDRLDPDDPDPRRIPSKLSLKRTIPSPGAA